MTKQSGSEAGQWFFAMELVDGATLGAVCGRLQTRGSGASDVDLETWHATLSTACQEARAAEPGTMRNNVTLHTKSP